MALALLTSAVSGLQINRKVSKREEVAAKEFSDSAYVTHATTQTGFNSTLRPVEEKNIVKSCTDVYIPVPIGQSGMYACAYVCLDVFLGGCIYVWWM